MSGGNCRAAREMAAWTSWAAASMSRFRLNWSVISVPPCELVEIMLSRPEMVENCRSSGSATDEAIVSGVAPGRFARTIIVGKSTFGRSLTGSDRYAMTPKIRMPDMTSVVMTGRRMNGSARFMTSQPPWRRGPARLQEKGS
jgi:hypothetical protein